MATKNEIQQALFQAMKDHNEPAKRTLKMVISAIKQVEIDKRIDLTENDILALIQREIKTRNEAIDDAKKLDRQDLITLASEDIKVLETFLPKQLSQEELKVLAEKVIQETGASSAKDMGNVMKLLLPLLEGRASNQEASSMVKSLLS